MIEASFVALVGLLPRLWVPAGEPLRGLPEEAAWWAEDLPRHWAHLGEPFERELLDAALASLEDLHPSRGVEVLVNQDLHAGNVLRASREPWLVIERTASSQGTSRWLDGSASSNVELREAGICDQRIGCRVGTIGPTELLEGRTHGPG